MKGHMPASRVDTIINGLVRLIRVDQLVNLAPEGGTLDNLFSPNGPVNNVKSYLSLKEAAFMCEFRGTIVLVH